MANLTKLKFIAILKGAYFYVPIFTLYFLDAGVGLTAIVFSQVFYSLTSLLGEIPTGLFADKFGQKPALVLGYLIEALGLIMLLIFPNTIGLYIAFAIRGVSSSFLSGAEEALFYESHKASESKESYQKEFGTFNANRAIGFLFSAILVGILVQLFGKVVYQPLILANALMFVAAFFISLTLKDIKSSGIKRRESIFNHLKKSILFVRKDSLIFGLVVVSILTLNAEFFLRQIYQPLFISANVAPIFLGGALAIGTALNIVFVKYSYLLEKFLSLSKIMFLIYGLTGVLYLFLAFVIGPIYSVLFFVLLSGMFNIDVPIISDYVNERISSDQRSTVLSTISFIRSLFDMGIRLILGVLVGVIGIQTTLALQGVYMIIGIMIGYYILTRCGCTYKLTHRNTQ